MTYLSKLYLPVTGTECLKELHDTGARNEMGVDLGRPADGICDWVYDKSDSRELRIWRDWRDSSDSGILLLTGDIGTGKSTLAFQLVDALRNDPALQSRLVIACFCKFQGGDTSKSIFVAYCTALPRRTQLREMF